MFRIKAEPGIAAEAGGRAQSEIKETRDAVWDGTNAAATRLLREQQQQPSAPQPLERLVVEQARAPAKKSRRRPPPKETAADAPLPPPPPPPEENPPAFVSVPAQRSVGAEPEILTLEQHNNRDAQAELFEQSLRAMGRAPNDVVIQTPPATEVLAYCARFRDEMPWFATMQAVVAASPTLQYPDVPVFCRAVLLEYLREAHPRSEEERPCFNLDRDPMPHERRFRCVAHALSESRLGPGKGFRLREMLFGPTRSAVPEMCYLCHLWFAMRDSTAQRESLAARESVLIINRFMVMVDVVGEYDRTKMLACDKVNAGLWGPIPLYNENNYIVADNVRGSGLRGFHESDNLLFRLTRVSPSRTQQQPVAAACTPSGPARDQ